MKLKLVHRQEALTSKDQRVLPVETVRVRLEDVEGLKRFLDTCPRSPEGEHLAPDDFTGYVSGELNAVETERVELHLAACADCTAEAQELLDAISLWATGDAARRLALRRDKLLAAERISEPATTSPAVARTSVRNPRPQRSRLRGDFVVAIDIGSSKVGVLIGHTARTAEGQGVLEVVGRGSAPNRGTRKGNIVNVEATVEALKAASEEAEVMAGVEISRAYVGIAGVDVRCLNSHGMVCVARKDREITPADVKRVLEAAQSAPLPSDREILHAIPQEFVVDEQGGIGDPVGMLGSRLEVNVHLVTGNVTRSRTLLTCVNRAGIEVVRMVFEPLATGEAVLTLDEKELGVLLVDIGAGTTDYAYFADGEVYHSAVLPIGAGHFTNDLAMVLRTPFGEAERIKTRTACCLSSLVAPEQSITVPSVTGKGERAVTRRELCEILQPRAEEMFRLVREDLKKHGFDEPPRGGVVLTGGGAQLDGLLEMAEQIFDTGVRFGVPQQDLGGLVDVISSPAWATASGLLLYARAVERLPNHHRQSAGFSMRSMVGSVRNLLQDLI